MKIFTLFVIAMLGVAFLAGCTMLASDTSGSDLNLQQQGEVLEDVDNSFVDESDEMIIGEMI